MVLAVLGYDMQHQTFETSGAGNKALLMTEINKNDLPEKICPVCNRPFLWRKKWEKNWQEIVYCSAKCRRNKKKPREE